MWIAERHCERVKRLDWLANPVALFQQHIRYVELSLRYQDTILGHLYGVSTPLLFIYSLSVLSIPPYPSPSVLGCSECHASLSNRFKLNLLRLLLLQPILYFPIHVLCCPGDELRTDVTFF